MKVLQRTAALKQNSFIYFVSNCHGWSNLVESNYQKDFHIRVYTSGKKSRSSIDFTQTWDKMRYIYFTKTKIDCKKSRCDLWMLLNCTFLFSINHISNSTSRMRACNNGLGFFLSDQQKWNNLMKISQKTSVVLAQSKCGKSVLSFFQ